MVVQTITAVVAEDGTIHLPNGAAKPGDTVVVHIERAEANRSFTPEGDEYLTVLTANTPEKKERFLQHVREWGQRNRSEMSQEHLDSNFDEWMYDENGLPKLSSPRSSARYPQGV